MIAAIQQCRFQADHRISCQNAVVNRLLQAFFNCREEVFGHTTAEHFFFKDEIALCGGLKFDPHITELAVTARLFLMAALCLALFPNGFAV